MVFGQRRDHEAKKIDMVLDRLLFRTPIHFAITRGLLLLTTVSMQILSRELLEPLSSTDWETEFIHLGGKKIRGFTTCHRCFDTKDRWCT